MAGSVLDEAEAETLDELRAQIAAIRALPTAGTVGRSSESVHAYRYSFELPDDIAPDAFFQTLQLKAAEAHRFVGVIDSCQRRADESVSLGFVRDIVVKPAPGVVVSAIERVALDTEQRTVLFRQRASVADDRFCCINSVVSCGDGSRDGRAAEVGATKFRFEGVYCYPTPRDADAFLADNAAMFERLEAHTRHVCAPGSGT